tara:strand:+ start:929 stop:2128 length:1200 start_codon:yes stop_codon:yes gene_type:complete
MNDLLKEAIADAKAVRKTALANAKLALEEAFTPKLQSMISAKIREEAEVEDLEEEEMEDHNEMREDEEHDMEEGGMREDEDEELHDGMREDEEHDVEEGGMREDEDEELHDGMREDEETHDDAHHESHDEMREDEHEDEPVAEEDDLELEAIIKELEDEIEEDEHEELEEGHEDELEESNDASSGIGASDNKQPAPAANADSTDDPEGTGAKVVAESEDGMEGESETLDNLHEEEGDELEEGEDIDLEEVIRSLREEEEELEESEDGMEGESETINNLTEKLKESYSVVKFLRSKINEVNLLNAKLLFTNKLFRNGNLNESQKLKVIETFDRAKSTREVKLVYTTLAESTMATRTTRNKKAIKEGFASKAVASTKPRRSVLSEGADMASRFKKLAGLTK